MYTDANFKTKKALKEAVANGRQIGVYQPNDMFGNEPPRFGDCSVEGPHYPKPHTWYARVTLRDGYIIRVDGKLLYPEAPKPTVPAMTVGAVLARTSLTTV